MCPEADVLAVGIGELKISNLPGQELAAYGLGSCIGLVLWGPAGGRRVLAMAHVVMPDSHGRRDGGPAKYADLVVPDVVQRLLAAGCRRDHLQAVMAGGACMFPGLAALGDIGAANGARVRRGLQEAGIPLRSAEIGGNRGRTLLADVATGRISSTTAGGAPVILWPAERLPEPIERGPSR